MKRFVSILLVIVMSFSLCACNKINGTKTSEKSEAERKIISGKITGDTYISDFADICFTKSDAFEFASAEERAALYNVGEEIYEDEDISKYLEEDNSSFYDMLAQDEVTGSSVSVIFEKLPSSYSDITDKEYFEQVKEHLGKQDELEFSYIYTGTVTLGDVEYFKASADVYYMGMGIEQYFYIRNIDGYIVNITVTITPMATYSISDIEEMFD